MERRRPTTTRPAACSGVGTSLGLPEDPDALPSFHVTTLDKALRVSGRPTANTDVRVDEAGKSYVTSDRAVAELPSLIDLRKRVAAMLPRVDIGEQISEILRPHTWHDVPERDQRSGVRNGSYKIVLGTDRGCLHAIDPFCNSGAADLPQVLVTDIGSYSDLLFGIAQLLGVDYRSALADPPDRKGWRTATGADYGNLNTFARGKLDLDKVWQRRNEILWLIVSICTSQVGAYDVVRALQRDGHPTALSELIATYGRVFKTLHILSIIDSKPCRRGIKGILNPPEGRRALAGKIFHGRRREMFQ